jgi:uncharacterized delta-60 repeat protein
MQPPQPLLDALESRLLFAAGFIDVSFRGDPLFTNPQVNGEDITALGNGLFIDPQMTAINGMAVQRDGKLVAVGYRNDAMGATSQMVVTRFQVDGALDTGFGNGGRVTIDFGRSSVGRAVAIAKSGDILVAGGVRGTGAGSIGSDVALARLNSDGTLDHSFSSDGLVITDVGTAGNTPDVGVDLGIDRKNRIVVGVRNNSDQGGGWTIVRYRSDGALDDSFAVNGILSEASGTLNAIEVLKNGKVLAAGELDQSCSDGATACAASSATILRYTDAGARDATFGVGGVAVNSFQSVGQEQIAFTDIAVQGKHILAAGLNQTQSRSDAIVARFSQSGIRDSTFNPPATLLPDDRSALRDSDVKLALQPDKKIVIGMTSSTLAGHQQNFAVVRLNSSGAFDDSFDADGLTNISFDDQLSTLHALTLQPQEGRILLGGRAFDISPGSPELANAAVAALEGFKKVTGPDHEAPRAILQTQHPEARGTETEFIVRYIDNQAIDRATLDNHDILVTGPNGFRQTAKLMRVDGSEDDLRALYSIIAPGGHWNRADEGRYTISLQNHQVADKAGNFAPAKELGRFRVQFAPAH